MVNLGVDLLMIIYQNIILATMNNTNPFCSISLLCDFITFTLTCSFKLKFIKIFE